MLFTYLLTNLFVPELFLIAVQNT